MALTEVNSLGIKDLEVKTADIAADAITGAKIADDAIDSEHYTNASIDHAHLANDCVDGDNISDDAVDSEHYVNGSIDHAHLANDCVDSDNIADNQVGLAAMAGIARGRLIVGDASGDPSYLSAGGNDQILTMDANGDVGWEDPAAGGAAISGDTNDRLVTAKGDGNLQGEANLTFDGNALTMGDGNIKFALGHGLDFSLNTDGGDTSTSGIFEDYEEGSWTPALTFGGGNTGITISSNHIGGYYTKVGNLVMATGFMYLSSKGTSTGHAEVSLPYQPAGHSSPYTHGQWGMCSESGGWNHNFTAMVFRVRADATKAYFQPLTSSTTHHTYGDDDDFTNSTKFIFTCLYRSS